MLGVFGFNLASPLVLHFRPGKMPVRNKINNKKKLIKAFDSFLAKIKSGKKDKPSLDMMVPFGIFKYISQKDSKVMSADYKYYKDKGDYYYDTKIPFYKKMIAKRVVNKITAGFE
jgi:hypothetical protein